VSLTQYYAAPSLDGFIADADNSLDWLLTRKTDDDGPLSFCEFMAGVGAMAMGTTTYEWILDQEPADDTLAGWTWPPKVPCWVFTHRELPGVPGDFVAAKFSVAP
jgi:dihydrofolate reductase